MCATNDATLMIEPLAAVARGLQHRRDRVLAAEQHAQHVDVHRLLVRLDAGGDRIVVVAEHHAGVVVEHVQTAEGLDRDAAPPPRSTASSVTSQRTNAGLATGRGDRLDHLVAVGHVGDDDLRTLGGEPLGTDPPETRRCTGDEGDLARQTTHGAEGSRRARLDADDRRSTPRPIWRVMTWNVRGQPRPDLAALAEVIAASRPTSVALQEIRRGQARALATALGWQHVWARKHYPCTPLLWWLAEGHAIARPHALSRRTLRVARRPARRRGRTATGSCSPPRCARADDELRVYDTHLAAHRATRRADRAGRARRRDRAGGRDDARAVDVVAGDLNADGEVEVLRELRAAGLVDPAADRPTVRRRRGGGIDYVLVPDGSTMVDRARARRRRPSGASSATTSRCCSTSRRRTRERRRRSGRRRPGVAALRAVRRAVRRRAA